MEERPDNPFTTHITHVNGRTHFRTKVPLGWVVRHPSQPQDSGKFIPDHEATHANIGHWDGDYYPGYLDIPNKHNHEARRRGFWTDKSPGAHYRRAALGELQWGRQTDKFLQQYRDIDNNFAPTREAVQTLINNDNPSIRDTYYKFIKPMCETEGALQKAYRKCVNAVGQHKNTTLGREAAEMAMQHFWMQEGMAPHAAYYISKYHYNNDTWLHRVSTQERRAQAEMSRNIARDARQWNNHVRRQERYKSYWQNRFN